VHGRINTDFAIVNYYLTDLRVFSIITTNLMEMVVIKLKGDLGEAFN